ncbi:Crp/Fnr family transcriptional regulator [Mucilaginibacter conchicola]|uniref:Crp/Fnr family transcriptional regulator n=1 Tax=Mucilaginibacter conchicola TaxID=2303333 RepID=A0A372NTS3_9SPHI|nr:Crp/Fnr family transcriptional regulator [Mucilaginibacter conchicola]RFZ91987.1 Crp/Fnr family transcriptional regulator [Mucilaginibacter conchicola]
MSNPLISFLQQHRFFSAEEQDAIAAAFERRRYKEGDQLLNTGQICRELFFICDGVLRIMATNQKGVELTHFFLKEGSFCTILYSFNNDIPADEGIQAACDTEVLVINKTKLTELYTEVPGLKELIDRITQEKLLEKIKIRNAYLGEESEARYHLFLKQQPDVARRVPLKDIAGYLGITPQSLSRIRKSAK